MKRDEFDQHRRQYAERKQRLQEIEEKKEEKQTARGQRRAKAKARTNSRREEHEKGTKKNRRRRRLRTGPNDTGVDNHGDDGRRRRKKGGSGREMASRGDIGKSNDNARRLHCDSDASNDRSDNSVRSNNSDCSDNNNGNICPEKSRKPYQVWTCACPILAIDLPKIHNSPHNPQIH